MKSLRGMFDNNALYGFIIFVVLGWLVGGAKINYLVSKSIIFVVSLNIGNRQRSI